MPPYELPKSGSFLRRTPVEQLRRNWLRLS
uniref:Uncharacterized protein LOC100786276 n=1 Tax=Rhizophora mucronata TaxID=61149 RepID=A0A2P2JQU0_RHIMU